jgi:chromosome segregation ATPase
MFLAVLETYVLNPLCHLGQERADSEKMDLDSEQIADLQARADLSTARAVKSEQALSVALADLREARKHSKEELSRATEEIEILQQKLASCIAALESKDVELSNLQSALGQYYAESEAQVKSFLVSYVN